MYRELLNSKLVWRTVVPLLDITCFLAVLSLVYKLRVGQVYLAFFNQQNLLAAFTFICCVLGTVSIMGGYRTSTTYRTLSFMAEFILAVAVGMAVGIFLQYVVFAARDLVSQTSRAVLVISCLGFLPFGLALRILLTAMREHVASFSPYLVIGSAQNVSEFAESYHRRTGLANPLEFGGPCETEKNGPLIPEMGFDRARLQQQLKKYEGIILCDLPSSLEDKLLQLLVRIHFNVLPVYTMNSFYATMWRQVPTLNLNLAWTLEQNFTLSSRSYYRYIKRILDITIAITIFILSLPLLILIAIAIKFESDGPLFFVQPRAGFQGEVFKLYKFRTMKAGSDVDGAPYPSENDCRITRVGRIIRRLRLDEIPQVLNILKGDMSLIGPRAEWTRLVDVYEKEIPYYHLRHLVKPGLTGWAQLNYRYGAGVEDATEKLRFDLYYIKFYSLLLDLEIILKTVLAMISAKGK